MTLFKWSVRFFFVAYVNHKTSWSTTRHKQICVRITLPSLNNHALIISLYDTTTKCESTSNTQSLFDLHYKRKCETLMHVKSLNLHQKFFQPLPNQFFSQKTITSQFLSIINNHLSHTRFVHQFVLFVSLPFFIFKINLVIITIIFLSYKFCYSSSFIIIFHNKVKIFF